MKTLRKRRKQNKTDYGGRIKLLKSGKLRDFEYEHILNQPNSKAGQTQERIGLVMIGFGIILSAGSYFLAAPGETYVVYTGLILWGGYLAFISS